METTAPKITLVEFNKLSVAEVPAPTTLESIAVYFDEKVPESKFTKIRAKINAG
jgi:hypothetical protein